MLPICLIAFAGSSLKVRFHNQVFATNLLTTSLKKSPPKQMSHIVVRSLQAAEQIGLLQTY
jgi:hypothetical protein